MEIRNPHDEPRYLPAVGDYVDAGAVVDLPDEAALSLIEQGWQAADAVGDTKPERRARRAGRAAQAQADAGGDTKPDPTTPEADPAAPQED